jgi:hypothetical protein
MRKKPRRSFDLQLDMVDADRWVVETVHLGTRQVEIDYDSEDMAAVIAPTWPKSDRES